MKRAGVIAMLAALCLAQDSRSAYRAAYRAWREADPNLERDAAGGGPPIAQRADRMAAESAKWSAARQTFLRSAAVEEAQQIAWLQGPAPGVLPAVTSAGSATEFVTAEAARVTRAIDAYTGNPDKGIQKLRQTLVEERSALDALGLAAAQRGKSAGEVDAASAAVEGARSKALDQAEPMMAGLKDAAADAGREGETWAEYYRKLGQGAQGAATPITQVPAGVTAVTVNNPVVAPPTVTPVPLERYVGAWTYPQSNGLFHGAQPEFVDLVVHEDQGHATGTLFARFKLPEGSTGDPVLRFDFSGSFQSTRNQVFSLTTSDGTKGSVELIPGPAFNLLEVNFQTAPQPGKVRQADVILVKK